MPALQRIVLSACVMTLAFGGAACQPKRAPLPTAAAQKAQEQGPKELQQIEDWEMRRSLGNGQLVQLATAGADPQLRARALLALARIAAPSTAPAIAQALQDPAPEARAEAAFAAGQLGTWIPISDATRELLVTKLLAAEESEAELPVHLSQLEALGKQATPAAVDRLMTRLLGTSPEVAARAALSLGVAAKRGATLPGKLVTSTAPLMKADAHPGARFGAAYALAMSKLPAARPALLVCTHDPAGEVRLLCARGLGEVGTENDAVTLKALLDDPDYRVVVEATRALAKLSAKCRGACPAVAALADLNFRVDRLIGGDVAGGGQPLLALAQQGLPLSGRPLLAALRGRVFAAEGKATGTLKGDLANLDCRLAAAMDRQQGRLAEVLNCGGGTIPEARRLALGLHELAQAPAKDPAKRVQEVTPWLLHADPEVKIAALDALGETHSITAADRIRPLISSDDLILATDAAAAAGKVGDTQAIPAIRALAAKIVGKLPEEAQPIADALVALKAKDAEVELRSWLAQPHPNLRVAAAQALTQLTGQKVEVPEVEYAKSPVQPHYLPKNAKLVIATKKGDIEVKLYQDSPVTSANLYALAQRGFYRHLTFHRVVPDFVVQGGDPRGDGEGGPGYTIPDEVNHHPYASGVVGMALSGPDTGGSQFFITTSPQPHLDGRYTSFGEVISGREVVHQLLEGDEIVDVRAR